ncbi:hypothetical protein [Mesorhizobium sp.]|uniref:hypothetical protein n=1 Tax=Mesorhizobium sp. TaxID=1871066 RepID=UPI000FE707EC|nr:hypothetical protein [Mesorhizobium sp.]RWN31773.1 MAG: hypothetical protein EOR95_18495 [Mesorhizobium sp.]
MQADRPRLRRASVPGYLCEKFGIDIAVATLNKLASIGGGPVMQYSGRIPLYHVADLDAWAAARLSKRVSSTSERDANDGQR